MGGEKRADACLTDPPYNYDYKYKDTSDNLTNKEYEEFIRKFYPISQRFSKCRVITPGLKNIGIYLENFGMTWICAWVKPNAMTASKIGNLSVWEPIIFEADDWDWEPVIIYGKPSKKVKRDVYEFPIKVQDNTANHPCPKLLDFWKALVSDFTKKNETVLDIFLGSGTTIIACHNLGRKARCIEISPAYCSVAIQRFADAFPSIEIKKISP